MLTLAEIKERILARYEPEDLIELLEVTIEELLDRFEDKLIMYYDDLVEELGADETSYYRD